MVDQHWSLLFWRWLQQCTYYCQNYSFCDFRSIYVICFSSSDCVILVHVLRVKLQSLNAVIAVKQSIPFLTRYLYQLLVLFLASFISPPGLFFNVIII